MKIRYYILFLITTITANAYEDFSYSLSSTEEEEFQESPSRESFLREEPDIMNFEYRVQSEIFLKHRNKKYNVKKFSLKGFSDLELKTQEGPTLTLDLKPDSLIGKVIPYRLSHARMIIFLMNLINPSEFTKLDDEKDEDIMKFYKFIRTVKVKNLNFADRIIIEKMLKELWEK